MVSDKAPGLNWLTIEWYKRFIDFFDAKLDQEISEKGILSPAFQKGY